MVKFNVTILDRLKTMRVLLIKSKSELYNNKYMIASTQITNN